MNKPIKKQGIAYSILNSLRMVQQYIKDLKMKNIWIFNHIQISFSLDILFKKAHFGFKKIDSNQLHKFKSRLNVVLSLEFINMYEFLFMSKKCLFH